VHVWSNIALGIGRFMVDYAIKLGNCLFLLIDSIKSSNVPPSTMLNSLLTIPPDFFSQQALRFEGCRQEVIYHSYPGSPKAKMLKAVKERLLP
jgi:hypothetical protein